MRALAVAALLALLIVPSALGGENPLKPPIGIKTRSPELTAKSATTLFLAEHKVSEWLDRYPEKGRVTDATYDKKSGEWEVKVWWGAAGEIATGKVVDGSGLVLEAWTGPQVAWKMARGYSGAFGGTVINNTWVWLGFCAVFLIGLGNIRRPLSWRNLDLIALLFFSVSLWYFNEGDIFTSVPLAYPPMFYLVGRLIWIGCAEVGGQRLSPHLAGVAARRRDGLPARLPDRDQRRGAPQRDRRRLLGSDRRRPDLERAVAVRPHADRGLLEALREGGLER